MILLMLGCLTNQHDPVELSGTLFDGPDDGAAPVAGATVTARDAEGTTTASTTSDEDGDFSIEVPSWQAFELALDADGFATTAYAGSAGADGLEVTDGALWLRSEAALDDLRALHSACATSQAEGGVFEGEARLYIPGQADSETLPLITTAWATAWSSDGTAFEGCYLDDEGLSSADATTTGNTGRFAIFGVPSGPISVEVSYTPTDLDPISTWYFIWLPEDAVAPMYPVVLDLP